ncbi:hypothetical protein AJ80_02808 [Polytolypa hystricis UAMH7299]|uniref:Amino-acid N-acetyltransferase subunit Mak10 n=1 Tax=Polytolypa hystricis (strain UAMH7299) TaxID=1447883 RepID=A0A2B7YQ49_POLH7|nr:hypothetical protein AJ80_02808 [Polytolypa hystricis UAMH7299]
MDSKMDSGYLAPGETLDDDYDVLKPLLPEEVIGIMDQLLSHEVAWHMGHPLSQTLFTSLYLDQLLWPVPTTLDEARFDRGQIQRVVGQNNGRGDTEGGERGGGALVNLVLRAYCLALIKACDRVNTKVASEYYYEEEDFVTQLYNRKLLSDIDSAAVQDVVKDALSWLDTQQDSINTDLRNVLSNRLIFRREFLIGLELDTSVVREPCTTPFSTCLRQIGLIHASQRLGRPVDDAFSVKIQRRLASTVPPRPMVKLGFDDAMAHLTRFCQDAIDVQEILEYTGPSNLQALVWAMQSRKPQPAVYIRSLMQSLLVYKNTDILGSLSVKQFIQDDLTQLVLPTSTIFDPENDEVEIPSDPRFQIARLVDDFIKRVSQPFVDMYRTTCLNRCRVRRTLCHSVIDWDHLQAEAEEVDIRLRDLTHETPITLFENQTTYAYPLSSWAYHQKLQQLRLILQLGFELDIYAPHELAGMYYYLSHICSTHVGHLDRIRSCVIAAHEKFATTASLTSDQESAYERTFTLLDALTTQLIATDAFAIALHALYALLTRHNLLSRNNNTSTTATTTNAANSSNYSTPRLRYELRMRPFTPIALPELIPYEIFAKEAALLDISDENILDRAGRAIAEAKRNFEKMATQQQQYQGKGSGTGAGNVQADVLRTVKDELRACIGASIAIGGAKKIFENKEGRKGKGKGNGNGGGKGLRVEIPDVGSRGRWHDWWAVPKVMEGK